MTPEAENQIALDLDRYRQASDQVASVAMALSDVGREYFWWLFLSRYDIMGGRLVVEHPDLILYMHRWMGSGCGYARKKDTGRLYFYIRFAWIGVAIPQRRKGRKR